MRLHLVQTELEAWCPPTTPPMVMLDAGGGFGALSRLYAEAGHQVHICDISNEMLQHGQQLHGEQSNVTHHVCPVQALDIEAVDLILCHAVLEWVEDQAQFIAHLSRLLRPKGRLSLLFYNRHALRFKRMLYGEIERLFAPCETGHGKSLTPCYPCDPNQIKEWLTQCQFELESESGIRCISDYIDPSILKTMDKNMLFEAERLLSTQSPYREMARYIHIRARKQ